MQEERAMYKVYEGYLGKRCVRVFDRIEDAQIWCWSKDRDEPYRIEWVTEDGSKRHQFI